MSLSNIVSVNVSASSQRVARAGFGKPLIVSHSAAWVERQRRYSSLTAVAVDFASTTPEYKAAAAAFAQDPRPSEVVIGRANDATAKPTQRWKITPVAANSRAYTVTIDGVDYTYTSDASATVAEIVTGLIALINAATGTHGLVATDGTTHLVLTANAVGAWAQVVIDDISLFALEQDHALPAGLADALAAIKTESNDFYGLVTTFNSKAYVEGVAAWAEANDKIYVADTQDTPCITDALVSATDIMKSMKDLARERTSVIYCPDNGACAGAAWQGRCLPLDPGSETWKFKTLSGVPVGSDGAGHSFTATHIANLQAKYGNWYEEVAGRNITQDGKVAADEWIDIVRFIDWTEARLGEDTFAALAANDKVPFTDKGAAVLESVVRAVLREGQKAGGIAFDPAPIVSVPKVATVSAANRAIRHMPDVEFEATLQGAIHQVTITGRVTP